MGTLSETRHSAESSGREVQVTSAEAAAPGVAPADVGGPNAAETGGLVVERYPGAPGRLLVERVHELCPLPATAQRVIALCSRPDTHVEQVAEAVAADPALAAEVLRLANSASVGGRAEVTDLGRALVTIGLQRLNTMAAALSMFAVFSKKTELSLGLHDRAVLAGALARSLAGELRADRSIAFVCGLLSEIGAMAMLSLDAAEYARLYRAAGTNATERERLENLRYGISARELGGALMRKNGIPETLAAAVEASPEGAGASTDVMHKLTVFAREASITLSADVTPGTLTAQSLGQRLEHVLSVLGIAVPPERIVELCLGAATKTVNVLRRVR